MDKNYNETIIKIIIDNYRWINININFILNKNNIKR